MDRDLWILQQQKVVSSTWYPHKEIQKETWKSPDGKTNNRTGHTLIDKRSASSIPDVKSCRVANSNSKHFWSKENIDVKHHTESMK
jgi:hypothetical protein